MWSVLPVVLALAYGVVAYQFSVRRTRRALDAHSSELNDPLLGEYTRRMAEALELPRIRVHIYEIEPINGLAAPDGRIFITRGFYRKYRAGEVSSGELASVVAHELGHIALGHSRRRMIDFSGQNALRTALVIILGRFVPFVGPLLANIAVRAVAAGLSRADEYEADAYAAALLVKSEIGTKPQKDLFRKLEKLGGGFLAPGPAWLLGHPATADRIKAIEALERKWQCSQASPPPKAPLRG
ncbi:MAG: M48 family metalloprotease [Rhodobacteraceae bacterium]|nr:M48 family metalloprotease [Paracoccaceae bacterium]